MGHARVSLLEPALMGQIQLTLIRLYQRACEELDRVYARAVAALDALPHLSLMKRLEVDRKYWLVSPQREAIQRGILAQVKVPVTPACPAPAFEVRLGGQVLTFSRATWFHHLRLRGCGLW
jgi:hypothetical protein